MTNKIEIKIKGILDSKWEEWFEEMKIQHQGGNTILSGTIKDTSHVHGILNRIRDLNLKLISVNPIEKNNNNL